MLRCPIQTAITIIDNYMSDTDIETILAELQAATEALDKPVEPDATRDTKTGRFVKGNKASKGIKREKKKTEEPTVTVSMALPEMPKESPITRTAKGQVADSEAARAAQAKTYKSQLREAIKKQAPAASVVSIMVANAMQTEDRRLAQEACRDLLDRVIGKPISTSKMHYSGSPQHLSINITALPAAEQEQFLLLSGKLLAQDMGDKWGDDVQEGELLSAPEPDNKG